LGICASNLATSAFDDRSTAPNFIKYDITLDWSQFTQQVRISSFSRHLTEYDGHQSPPHVTPLQVFSAQTLAVAFVSYKLGFFLAE
jgi:hypothetical protein